MIVGRGVGRSRVGGHRVEGEVGMWYGGLSFEMVEYYRGKYESIAQYG